MIKQIQDKPKIFTTNELLLALNAVIAVISFVVIMIAPHARDNKYSDLPVILSSIFFIGTFFPWIVYARRKWFKTASIPSRRMACSVNTLLKIAMLIGPILSIVSWLFWLLMSDKGLGHAVLLMFAILIPHGIGLLSYLIAFSIQLWYDKWEKIPNSLAFSYHILVVPLLYLFEYILSALNLI